MDNLWLNRLWLDALISIQRTGWPYTISTLLAEARTLQQTRQEDESASLRLIAATIQQKFGQLSDAKRELLRLSRNSPHPIAMEARQRLGKILSQQGQFGQAYEQFSNLVEESDEIELPASTFWRLAFLTRLTAERRISERWKAVHAERATAHGSQEANRLLFTSLVDFDVHDSNPTLALHDASKAFFLYGQHSLSVDGVKFLDSMKSQIVPMLHTARIASQIGQFQSAAVQLLIVSRLFRESQLKLASEGIGDYIGYLRIIGDRKFLQLIKLAFNQSEEALLTKLLDGRRSQRMAKDSALQCIESSTNHLTQNSILLIHPTTSTSRNEARKMISSPKVFIVHGRDQLNTLRLKELLSHQHNLAPIVLAQQANHGKTLIEKFESVAKECVYAFVLFTKDDEIALGEQSYLQPRPNVLFELGWFYGKLGRSKVALIYQKGISIPSDLDGIARIEFSENIEDAALQIARELKANAF